MIMSIIERFKEIYRENIKREGADRFFDYLMSTSDFTPLRQAHVITERMRAVLWNTA